MAKSVTYSVGDEVFVYGFKFEVVRTWVVTLSDGREVGRFEGRALTRELVGTGYDGGVYSASLQ